MNLQLHKPLQRQDASSIVKTYYLLLNFMNISRLSHYITSCICKFRHVSSLKVANEVRNELHATKKNMYTPLRHKLKLEEFK